jgi:hypothetical protein
MNRMNELFEEMSHLLDERPLKKVHVAPEAGNNQQARKRSSPQDPKAESVAEAIRPSSEAE